MDDLRAFDLEVLGWVAQDYESPHTIANDIARKLDRPISEEEVKAALLALAEIRLVQAYVYTGDRGRYQPINERAAENTEEVWFMATAAGLSVLESHAN
jgi:hypothetical protein